MPNTPALFPYLITTGNRRLTWDGLRSPATGAGPTGVYEDLTSNERYMPLLDTSVTPNQHWMAYSSDNGQTWAEVDAGNGPLVSTATVGAKFKLIFGHCKNAINRKIYVVYFDHSTDCISLAPFNLATQEWEASITSSLDYLTYVTNFGAPDLAVGGLFKANAPSALQGKLCVAFRPGDSAVWIAFTAGGKDIDDAVGVWGARCFPETSGWDAALQKLTGTDYDGILYQITGMCLDSGGNIQILFTSQTFGTGAEISITIAAGAGATSYASVIAVTAAGAGYTASSMGTGLGGDAGFGWNQSKLVGSNGVNIFLPLAWLECAGTDRQAGGAITGLSLSPHEGNPLDGWLNTRNPVLWQIVGRVGPAYLWQRAIRADDSLTDPAEVDHDDRVIDHGDGTETANSTLQYVAEPIDLNGTIYSAYVKAGLTPAGGGELHVIRGAAAETPSWTNARESALEGWGYSGSGYDRVSFARVGTDDYCFLAQNLDSSFDTLTLGLSRWNGSSFNTPDTIGTIDQTGSDFASSAVVGNYYSVSGTQSIAFSYGPYFTTGGYPLGIGYWELSTSPPVTVHSTARYIARFNAPGN